MKIIAVDNYDTGMVSDMLIAENVNNTYYAEKIVDLLNSNCGDDRFFKLVSDDYKLYDCAELYE